MPILGNNVFEGYLKPGRLIYDSVDLGLSVEDIEVRREKNNQEITADQFGTREIDDIETGSVWFVVARLTGYSITQLQKVLTGMVISAGGNTARMGSDCFKSKYDNAKTLVLKRVDCDNAESADDDYWLTFVKAYPMNETDILMFGPNDQENFEITFKVYKDRDSGSDTEGLFWYSGQASTALL